MTSLEATAPLFSPLDIETLARTLYGEARGEGYAGQVAVAWVALNRFRKPGWWSREKGDGIPDDTVAAVCRDPWQFSCWLESDPNRAKLLAVGTDSDVFRSCLVAAAAVLGGLERDPTGGACHYFVKTMPSPPKWSVGKSPCYAHGAHVFFNDVA